MKITNKYLVEVLVFLSYVLFAMAWVGGTASMRQIMQSMDIDSLASASFISGAVTFAKIVGTFGAAWLAVKFGVKMAFFIASKNLLVFFETHLTFLRYINVRLTKQYLLNQKEIIQQCKKNDYAAQLEVYNLYKNML